MTKKEKKVEDKLHEFLSEEKGHGSVDSTGGRWAVGIGDVKRTFPVLMIL